MVPQPQASPTPAASGIPYEVFESDPFTLPSPTGKRCRPRKPKRNKPRDPYENLAFSCDFKGRIDDLRNAAKIEILQPGCQVHDDILEYMSNDGLSELRGQRQWQTPFYNIRLTKCRFKVRAIYKVQRNDDSAPFQEPYRMMLWHGTKPFAVPSIVQTGFRRGTHGLFGSGCYFADRIGKCAQYVAPGSHGTVFFILAEVSLGKVYKAHHTHNSYSSAPQGYDSVKGNGTFIPDWKQNKKYYDAILPCGPTVKNTRHSSFDLPLNEYILYDPDRIKIRFIVECTM